MLNFVYLRSSSLNFFNFWLDSCIANKGEKFDLEMACWTHLEGFQVVSSHFWSLLCTGLTGVSAEPVQILGTGLTGGDDRSDRCMLKLLQQPCFQLVCMHRPGGGALVQGELGCVQGELFVVFELWFRGSRSLLELGFCLGCVEPLPLPKGSEACLLQVILLFAFVRLSIACWSSFLFVSFLFLFSLVTIVWVLSMHSTRGRWRTMCGSRTGGWSLPCVMND
jgi:hypothetical protein